MIKSMVKIFFSLLFGYFLAGCESCTDENVYVELTLTKDSLAIFDYDGLHQEFVEKNIEFRPELYDPNETYVTLQYSLDDTTSAGLKLILTCGLEGNVFEYDDNTTSQYMALSVFSRQEMENIGCLQVGGQVHDIYAEVEGHARFTDKVCSVDYYYSSNLITYTSQEINDTISAYDNQ